jgi:hypothetical protein
VWPPQRIESYGVTPPAGSNPTVWPLPRDQILQCGPPCVIGDQGSDFPLWPLPVDWTFRCSPSRGSDFPLWPLPGDRIFRSGLGDKGPHRRIVRILFQSMQSLLKGQPVKNVSMVEQYYPKTMTFMLVICSSLKKKINPPRGATPWDRLRI